ncbi:class I SAM-dependent methyltransferase [Modestobacter excelsi]|uniref:class I SAM-dependent methyltransferase n=1 Tax=Modestobacter excelsi TaxID=2213161 RepID=UPI00110C945B|nr:class I SAM-dependent methyltransferase [Modestobacter excelsi]
MAVEAVGGSLPPEPTVFEFGGGGSTLWLHDLGARITSVEHDPEWFEVLRDALPASVELVLRPPALVGAIGSVAEPGHFFDAYVGELASRADESFDLIVVDGRARVDCGLVARGKVKSGGMLLLDDSDRPRYGALVDALSGWERADFVGLKVGGGGTAQTTVWRRP